MADDGYLIGYEDGSGNFVEVGRFNNQSQNTSDPVFIEHTGSGTRMELDGTGFDMGGGDITNAGSVNTGGINNDTDILLIGPSGDLIQRLDPTGRSTPIQDAWNQMPSDGGTIIYPPGKIETPGNLSGAGGIRHIGHGPQTTEIKDTNSSTPTYNAGSPENDVFFDGILFTGGGSRTAAGFVFDANCESWNLGPGMEFNFYSGDDLFHFKTGYAFSSTWDSIRAERYNRFLLMDDSGANLNVNSPYLGSANPSTAEIEINTRCRFRLGGLWNKGSSACPVVDASGATANRALINIGRGNYEPSNGDTVDFIHKVGGQMTANIGAMDIHGNYSTSGSYATVIADSPDRQGGVTVEQMNEEFPTVAITTSCPDAGAVIMDGAAIQCDNRTGSVLSGSVNCLADGVFKKSTSNGYDGGTNDTKYGP